jgi:hypothetical protein
MSKRKRELSFIERMERRLCGACREMMLEVEGDDGKPCLFCTKCGCAVGGTLSEERKARLGLTSLARGIQGTG